MVVLNVINLDIGHVIVLKGEDILLQEDMIEDVMMIMIVHMVVDEIMIVDIVEEDHLLILQEEDVILYLHVEIDLQEEKEKYHQEEIDLLVIDLNHQEGIEIDQDHQEEIDQDLHIIDLNHQEEKDLEVHVILQEEEIVLLQNQKINVSSNF